MTRDSLSAGRKCPGNRFSIQTSRGDTEDERESFGCDLILYLYTKVSPVNVISQEEILGGGGISADLKQLDQIVELAVNIPAH